MILDNEKILYLNIFILSNGFLSWSCCMIKMINKIILLIIVDNIIEFV